MAHEETGSRFCPRCDAPIYSDQSDCGYCGGGPSDVDFKAVAVLAGVVVTVLGLGWLIFA